ncbi:MAG: hypothetical protein KIT25_22185 [Enhydrobacter sp.]|nr:MAG: hypothetical protein KIT25_22185 [Enhydrobacter sp.]
MKTRLLHNLDLARIGPMTASQKRNALMQIKLGHPPHTLNPMRASIPDIMSIEAGLLPTLPRTPWAAIDKQIRSRCHSEDEEKANLAIGRALYEYADEHRIVGRAHDFFALALGMGRKVSYWSNAVVAIDGDPYIPFVDPRKAPKLQSEGRRFVFSAMHEHIRAADPDFAHVGLVILQFVGEDERRVVPYFADELELFSFEQLDAMVRETYAIWAEVLEGREADARRTGTGRKGTLL